MNDPRIPSLKGIMAAKRKPIDVVDVDAPSPGASVRLEHIRYLELPDRPPGRKLDGDPEEQVRELVDLLRDEARVLQGRVVERQRPQTAESGDTLTQLANSIEARK